MNFLRIKIGQDRKTNIGLYPVYFSRYPAPADTVEKGIDVPGRRHRILCAF